MLGVTAAAPIASTLWKVIAARGQASVILARLPRKTRHFQPWATRISTGAVSRRFIWTSMPAHRRQRLIPSGAISSTICSPGGHRAGSTRSTARPLPPSLILPGVWPGPTNLQMHV